MSVIQPMIIVHGGAGIYATIVHDQESVTNIEDGVSVAAKAGYAILITNGTALDAVEAAVVSMENNQIFNAGRGSCLTIDGQIEMDASIMDGTTLNAGCVACIRNVANPIKVARLVMDKSDHVLFCADGALQFAKTHGIEEVPTEYLITEKAKKRLANFPNFPPSLKVEFYDKKSESVATPSCCQATGEDHDTVGAVAIDARGHVAYATSTGGITAKMRWRVGDSPLVGCGGYADNEAGAVSTTGHGESFIKTCLAKHIAVLMAQGVSAQKAVESGLELMYRRVGGEGGCIAIDRHGNVGIHFTTQGMAWAYCQSDLLHYGVYQGDHMTVQLTTSSSVN